MEESALLQLGAPNLTVRNRPNSCHGVDYSAPQPTHLFIGLFDPAAQPERRRQRGAGAGKDRGNPIARTEPIKTQLFNNLRPSFHWGLMKEYRDLYFADPFPALRSRLHPIGPPLRSGPDGRAFATSGQGIGVGRGGGCLVPRADLAPSASA